MFKVVSKADLSSIDDVDRTRLLVSTARDWSQEEVISCSQYSVSHLL